MEAAELLAAYRADYSVSGHDHAFPYTSASKLEPKNERSVPAGTGQLLRASFPNYIELDTESGELSWHTASDKWIPKDGLYDRLVLKLAKD